MSSRLFIALTLVLLIAACSRNPLEVTISRCPAVAIVGDTGTIVSFADGARTQDDVAYKASIGNVVKNCDEGSSVRSNVSFDILVQAGDSFGGGPVALTYFVAVLKDNSQLISKQTYDVTVNLPRGSIAKHSETVETLIPSIDQARKYNYEILIGFQSSPNDVYFNMVR